MQAPSLDDNATYFLFDCLFGKDTHHFVTNYLLNNYPTHNVKFPIAISKVEILREKEFFIRFLNPDEFRKKIPNTRHTISEKELNA